MKTLYILFLILIISSCSNNIAEIKNEARGELSPKMKLELTMHKKIAIDSNTAPKPLYLQMFLDTKKVRNLTFLNTYTNSIYFYDYSNLSFIKKISFERKGPNGVLRPSGYYIRNLDSIYIYNDNMLELILVNEKSEIQKKISLTNNMNLKEMAWIFSCPQYAPKSVSPFIEINNEILLSGQLMESIPENIINSFQHTLKLNLDTNTSEYKFNYPISLYGNNYNWYDSSFTEVFSVLHPDGDKIICSYPVSHNLYIYDINSEKSVKVYGGSNFAGTIKSLDFASRKKIPREKLALHFNKQDLYGGILFDKWRNVYYRFLRKSIKNVKINTPIKKKKIAVIIMDKDFNYLGETVLGAWREWNWENSFVTKEGLNIEYLDHNNIDEVTLNFKIFQPKKI